MAAVSSQRVIDRPRFLAWPRTRFARRAALVSPAAFVWFGVLGGLAALRVPDWGVTFQAAVGVAGLVGVAAAISGGVAAVVAIARGERSLVLVVPLLFGVFWVMFVAGEFISPH